MVGRRGPARTLRALAAETRAAAEADMMRRNERECLLRTAVGLDRAAGAVEEARAEAPLRAEGVGAAERLAELPAPCLHRAP